METIKVRDFDGYELYPLNLCCPTVEEKDLQHLRSELEKASPSLFVENSNDCRVGVFEAIFESSEHHIRSLEESVSTREEDRPNQKKLLSTTISSLDEMQDTLRVNKSTTDSMHTNKITTEGVATR